MSFCQGPGKCREPFPHVFNKTVFSVFHEMEKFSHLSDVNHMSCFFREKIHLKNICFHFLGTASNVFTHVQQIQFSMMQNKCMNCFMSKVMINAVCSMLVLYIYIYIYIYKCTLIQQIKTTRNTDEEKAKPLIKETITKLLMCRVVQHYINIFLKVYNVELILHAVLSQNNEFLLTWIIWIIRHAYMLTSIITVTAINSAEPFLT